MIILRRHRFQYTFGFLFLLGVAIFCRYYLEWIDSQIFLGSVAALISIYLGMLRYQVDADRVFQELFVTFNARYDGMNEKLQKLDQNGSIPDRTAVVEYLNLCSEEYLWYRRGRVGNRVWKAWMKGIEEKLQNEHIRRIAREELEQAGDSYYGFLNYISDHLKN